MTLSTIITMLVGLLIPLLTAAITKANLPVKFKVLVTLFLSTVAGVAAGLINNEPTNLAGWKQVLLNIVMTYLTAAASTVQAWRPSGVLHNVTARTARFGIGPAEPQEAQAA